MMDISLLSKIIQKKCGLSFDKIERSDLVSLVRERMMDNKLDSYFDYLELIEKSDCEFYEIIKSLTINETYFYREPSHLDVLANYLIEEVLSKSTSHRKVRILSAGCSTGEEPYSIAIRLVEKYGSIKDIISIIGVDINSRAVEKAVNGIFSKNSFRDFPQLLKNRYFTSLGSEQYEIKKYIKECVEFYNDNLLNNAFSEYLQDIDIIFYRNVSIYFDLDSLKSIFEVLALNLNMGGYIVVGSAETLSHNLGILSLINIGGIFLYKKTDNELRSHITADISHDSKSYCRKRETYKKARINSFLSQQNMEFEDKKKEISLEPSIDSLFNRSLVLARGKKYKDALDQIDFILEKDIDFMKAYNLKANIYLNLKRMDVSKETCLKIIEKNQWDVEPYLLMGIIARQEGDTKEAVKWLKESLYIKSSLWTAHYNLAEIYETINKKDLSYKEYNIVMKLIEDGNFNNHGLLLFHFPFSMEELMILCKHKISRIHKGNNH